MHENYGGPALLGEVLVADGAVGPIGIDEALRAQAVTGERIGETLVRLGLICRPQLDRAVARQAGVELAARTGFGTGLRAAIERRHEMRRVFFG
jgi:hypothetical protein